MKKIIITAISTLMYCFPVSAEVSNIEFIRTDSLGKDSHTHIEASINSESGNQDYIEFDTSLIMTWSEGSSHFLALMEHNWRNVDDSVDKNQSYFHLRYTKELNSGSGHHVEFLVQGQKDRFREIESRVIGGIGYRLTTENKVLKRYNGFGVGTFYESEHATEEPFGKESDVWRLNTYWHHRQTISKTLYIENVMYYQPSLEELDDFRFYDEIRLTNKITDHISMGLEVTYAYDSTPIRNTKKSDTNIRTFLSYSF